MRKNVETGALSGICVLVTEAPPRVRRRQTVELVQVLRPRTVAIRHVTGHQLIALIEIVSRANKDRSRHVERLRQMPPTRSNKAYTCWVDLFPPGQYDPYGIHGIIRQRLAHSDEAYDLQSSEPLTLAAYAAGPQVEVYLEDLAVGDRLLEMPLFLHRDREVNVPLEPTYESAYRGVPSVWRDVLEKHHRP